MSHFTVMVIGDDYEDQLAPYDEEIRVVPYRKYWDDETLRWNEESLTEPAINSDAFVAERDEFGRVPLEDLVRAYNERWGDEGNDAILDPEGGVYQMSSYNHGWSRVTWCEGYNPSNHGQGSEADQPAREEVLRALRDDEAIGGLPASNQESRRTVHVLPELHEGTQHSADERLAPTVASDSEVRDHSGGIRLNAGAAERSLRDLSTTSIQETEALGGSFSREWESARVALREVQHALGYGGGELLFAPCGSRVPHAPHETDRRHIGGAKWDWYCVGGRWRGYFKLKNGGEGDLGDPGVGENNPTFDADECLKGDVDVEYMRSARGAAAGVLWDQAQEVLGDLPEARPWKEFYEDTLDPETGKPRSGAIEEARNLYAEQPRVATMKTHDSEAGWENAICGAFGPSVEDFQGSREKYVQDARDGALPAFAYVYRGEWFAPGKMGWFGMRDEEEAERKRFQREFNEFFDSLPDDTQLTLIDAHI